MRISAMVRILMLLDDIEDLLVDSSILPMLKEGGHKDERRMKMGGELYGKGALKHATIHDIRRALGIKIEGKPFCR